LGAKQSLSNGNEVEEITQLLMAFEAQASMRIAIVLYVTERAGKKRLLIGCGSAPALPLEQVLSSWGSVQSVHEAGDVVTLLAALTNAMYGLDYEMAEEEWRKTRK